MYHSLAKCEIVSLAQGHVSLWGKKNSDMIGDARGISTDENPGYSLNFSDQETETEEDQDNRIWNYFLTKKESISSAVEDAVRNV